MYQAKLCSSKLLYLVALLPLLTIFFYFDNQNNIVSKATFREASNHKKKILESSSKNFFC